jgi:protein TonB
MKAVLNNQTEYNISLLELIFSVRNKDYGAYALRTSYKRNLTIALFITIFVFVTSLVLPSLLKNKDDVKIKPKIDTTTIDLLPTPDIEQNKKNNIEIEQTVKMDVSKIKYIAPNVVKDELVKDEYFPSQDDIKGKVISTTTTEGTEGTNLMPDEIVIPTDPITVVDKEEPPVFTYVEEMPSYPGGTEELLTFINKNIEYPEIARRAGVEGRVLLGFVVERDGTITNINILKGIGAGCDEEAVRVLGLVGKWIPGRQNGKAVRVNIVMPFVFRLN